MAVVTSSRYSRTKELREISPERTKVWTEPANGKQKVPVVYYLSRNGQLQHPHFTEVTISSAQGLFLRDVICRLNVLRGKGIASAYSWSCKRSYKNGFVWHDLSENDFIYPAQGNEYVLKGSELLENTLFLDEVSPLHRQSLPSENQIAGGDTSENQRRRNQSCSSIDFNNNFKEYSVYKTSSSGVSAASDASTQTDDKRRRRRPSPEIDEIEISPPPSDSSPETLETLMKADKRLILLPETVYEEIPAEKKEKSSSVLMQLISCGSISFKDCGAGQGMGLISQYKLRLPRVTVSLGSGKVKLEEKEYFSGSIVETKKESFPVLKRSTSYGAGRTSQLELPGKEIEAKRVPRKSKTLASTTKEEISASCT